MWCSKCNSEHMDGGVICSSCGGHLEEKTTTISSQPAFKKNKVFKVILILCLLYALIGAVIWVLGMIDTDWSNMRPRCCGNCDKIWYSEYWDIYFWYTYPFCIVTFPILMIVFSIENSLVMSVFGIYLVFVPLHIFKMFVKLCKRFKKAQN